MTQKIGVMPSEIEHRAEYAYDLKISIIIHSLNDISKKDAEQILKKLTLQSPYFSGLVWQEEPPNDSITQLTNYIQKEKDYAGAFDLDEPDTSDKDEEITTLIKFGEKHRYEINTELGIKTKLNAALDTSQIGSSLARILAEEFYELFKANVYVVLQMQFTYHQLHDGPGYIKPVTSITSRIHNMSIRTQTNTSIAGTITRTYKRPPEEKGVVQKIKEWWNMRKAN